MRNVMICRITIAIFFLVCLFQAVDADELQSGKRKLGEAKLPNVVVIISDDQGWADIGYNNPKVYSPNLDRLARTGAKFTQHYVMPQCTPTRVALMTGRYPSRFGPSAQQANNEPAFPLGTPTLAAMFQERGYETCLTGKWHLGSSAEHGPNHFGFDQSYGSLAGAVGMYDHRYKTNGKYGETWHRDHKLIDGFENGTHATDLIAAEAVRFIKKDRATEAPFFLYVPFHAVHTPLDERGEFIDRPTQLDPKNKERWLNEDEIMWFNDPDGKIQKETDPEKRLLLAAVHHLDHAVGQIVEAIEETDQRKNTLILFSSDNGPQHSWNGNAYPNDLKLTDFNQKLPMRGYKVDVWEGGIHVPGFANWPGRIKAGELDQQMHIIDWFPTLANLIDYRPESKIAWDGVDIGPALLAGNELAPRDFYWIWNRSANRWAVRFGDWKIVRYGKTEPEKAEDWRLYNLRDDPKEQRDVAAGIPEVLADMHKRFVAQRSKDKR